MTNQAKRPIAPENTAKCEIVVTADIRGGELAGIGIESHKISDWLSIARVLNNAVKVALARAAQEGQKEEKPTLYVPTGPIDYTTLKA